MSHVIGIILFKPHFFAIAYEYFLIIILINLVDPTNMKEIRRNCFETEIPLKLN